MSDTVMQLSYGANMVVAADKTRGIVRLTCIENNHAATVCLSYWDIVGVCIALADSENDLNLESYEDSARESIAHHMCQRADDDPDKTFKLPEEGESNA